MRSTIPDPIPATGRIERPRILKSCELLAVELKLGKGWEDEESGTNPDEEEVEEKGDEKEGTAVFINELAAEGELREEKLEEEGRVVDEYEEPGAEGDEEKGMAELEMGRDEEEDGMKEEVSEDEAEYEASPVYEDCSVFPVPVELLESVSRMATVSANQPASAMKMVHVNPCVLMRARKSSARFVSPIMAAAVARHAQGNALAAPGVSHSNQEGAHVLTNLAHVDCAMGSDDWITPNNSGNT